MSNSIIDAQNDLRDFCAQITKHKFIPKPFVGVGDWVWYFNGEEKILCFCSGYDWDKGLLLIPNFSSKAINPLIGGYYGCSDYASWSNLKGNTYEEVPDL